jgi:hypothetical protein
MALHITDSKAEAAVRELARLRGLTLTRAVETAAAEAIARTAPQVSKDDKLKALQNRVASWRKRPDALKSHKEFFDWINDQA